MDRLTLRRGNYTFLVDDEYSKCKRAVGKPRLLKPFCAYAKECSMVETRECGTLKTADKLAAYEDTNLEPSAILALKAEVERLRAENDRINSIIYGEGFSNIETMIDKFKAVMFDSNEIAIEKDAEVDRLNALLAEQQKEMDITDAADRELHTAWESQNKEIDRLKAELIDYPHLQKVVDGQMAQNQRLRRIIEKLKAEQGNGNEPLTECAWCKGDWTDNFSVIDENFGQPLTYRHVKYCPMCGRKLKPEGGEG